MDQREFNFDAKDIPVMFVQYYINGAINTTEVRANYFKWKHKNPDGIISEVFAENLMHPMDSVNLLTRIEIPHHLHTFSFTFSSTPSSLTARYWPDQYAGLPEAYDIMYENLKVIGNSIMIPHGEHGFVLQVHAMWPQGYANYEIYLVPSIRLVPAS